MPQATGTFEVKLSPAPTGNDAPAGLARLSIDKTFVGGLSGTSRGEMLTAPGEVEGSAGYVAIERVTGELDGRSGEFLLQHFGIMNRGEGTLTVAVVPDSATGDLRGLTGTMNLNVAATHDYVFDYALA
jgi:hypothetical protein